MGACCGGSCSPRFEGMSPRYRRVLLVVIALNAGMFLFESLGGLAAGSVALQADALDFLCDALTYGITLAVIGRPPTVRAGAALLKGISLGGMAALVFGTTAWRVLGFGVPEPVTMGAIAVLALAVNLLAVLLLYRYRDGDANVRSVWLCSRNDAIGNIAVFAAAGAVAFTGTAWPDLVVAGAMAALFLTSSVRIIRDAAGELTRSGGVAFPPVPVPDLVPSPISALSASTRADP